MCHYGHVHMGDHEWRVCIGLVAAVLYCIRNKFNYTVVSGLCGTL